MLIAWVIHIRNQNNEAHSSSTKLNTETKTGANHLDDKKKKNDPLCSLSGCMITEKSCRTLASALAANPSHLRTLDLSYNHPGDAGVSLLTKGLQDPLWRLETLKYGQTDRQ